MTSASKHKIVNKLLINRLLSNGTFIDYLLPDNLKHENKLNNENDSHCSSGHFSISSQSVKK